MTTGRVVRWPNARQRAALRAKRVRRVRAKAQRPDRLDRALLWSKQYVDSLRN